MALMTAQEYVESLRKLNTRVYMFGEKIENWVDHPMIRPSINCVAMTYALAQDPQYADLMTVKSSLTGHTINRFTHLHQSTEDLINKVKMQRLLARRPGSASSAVCGYGCSTPCSPPPMRSTEVRQPWLSSRKSFKFLTFTSRTTT